MPISSERTANPGGAGSHWVAALMMGLGTLAVAHPAAGQACCSATGSDQFGIVGKYMDATIAAQWVHDRALGSASSDGRYRALSAGVAANDHALVLGAGARVPGVRPLQLNASTSYRLQQRALSGLGREWDRGLGDSSVGLRVTPVEDLREGLHWSRPRTWVPDLDLYGNVRLPSGRGPQQGRAATGADVTGRDGWGTALGLRAIKFVSQGNALTVRFAYNVNYRVDAFSPGNDALARVGWFYLHDRNWSGGVYGLFRATGPAQRSGVELPRSRERQTRLGAHLGRTLAYPAWEAMLYGLLDPPLHDFGQNVPFAGMTLGLAVQRNIKY